MRSYTSTAERERAPVDGDYVVDLLPSMILFGVGGGLFFAALMTLAMSAATASDCGLVNTTQQVGGAVGLAVLATFSTTRTESLLERGESTASALTSGYHLAYAARVPEPERPLETKAFGSDLDLGGAWRVRRELRHAAHRAGAHSVQRRYERPTSPASAVTPVNRPQSP